MTEPAPVPVATMDLFVDGYVICSSLSPEHWRGVGVPIVLFHTALLSVWTQGGAALNAVDRMLRGGEGKPLLAFGSCSACLFPCFPKGLTGIAAVGRG